MNVTLTDNMATQTGSTFISESTTDSVKITTANPAFSTTASLINVSPSDCDKDQYRGNGNVADKIGNIYISEPRHITIENPKAKNTRISATPSNKKLTSGDCENDRQPDVALL